MKDNKNDSPLFSDSILSTEDLFDEEEDFDNNGIDVDPNEVILSKPVQNNTIEIPTEDTFNIVEAPLDSDFAIEEAPLDPAEPFEEDLFMSEPVETPVQRKSKPTNVKVQVPKKTPNAEFFEDTSISDSNKTHYEDEPKKSFRKPLILGIMGLAVVGCLIWFITGIFGTDNNVTKEDTKNNQSNEIIIVPDENENNLKDTLTPNKNNNNNSSNSTNSNNGNSNNNSTNNNNSNSGNSGNNNTSNNNNSSNNNGSSNNSNNNNNNSNNNNTGQVPDTTPDYVEPDYPDDSVTTPSTPSQDEYSSDSYGTESQSNETLDGYSKSSDETVNNTSLDKSIEYSIQIPFEQSDIIIEQ